MKMELGLGSLWLEAGVGKEADDHWSLEPACQSGPDVAAYPELLPSTLGEHVEQNVSLATSPDAHLRRPVRVTALRRTDVCAMEPDPAPRKHAPPQAVYPRRLMGVWGVVAPRGQSRAGFSEQQFIILARKEAPTPDYPLRKEEPTLDYPRIEEIADGILTKRVLRLAIRRGRRPGHQ